MKLNNNLLTKLIMKLIKHTSIVPFRPDDVQKKLTHMMRDVNIRSKWYLRPQASCFTRRLVFDICKSKFRLCRGKFTLAGWGMLQCRRLRHFCHLLLICIEFCPCPPCCVCNYKCEQKSKNWEILFSVLQTVLIICPDTQWLRFEVTNR